MQRRRRCQLHYQLWSGTLTIGKATPKLTWHTPAAITYGTPLSAAQLDAGAADPTSGSTLPGSFSYTPAAGAVLDVGGQTLSVTFTPTNGTDYTTAGASVSLAVTPLPLQQQVVLLDGSSASCTLLIESGTLTASSVAVDGSNSAAACLNGGTLTASTITVHGGLRNQGGTVHGAVSSQAAATADPFAALPAPSAPSGACPGSACPGGATMNAGSYTLSPGTYSQPVTLNSGVTACLKSGIYVLNGSWTINGGSKLVACSPPVPACCCTSAAAACWSTAGAASPD